MPLDQFIILFISGIIGGLAAGMFGIGGGIIYVLVYNIFLANILTGIVPETIIVQLTILNAATSIFFAALIGSYRQYQRNNFYGSRVVFLGVTSAISAFFTTRILSGWSNYNQDVFLIVFTVALIPLIIKFVPYKSKRINENLHSKSFAITGIFTGIGSALSGLGGGFISNPILHGFLRYPIKKTFSISLGSMLFTSLGIIGYHLMRSSFELVPLPNFNGIIYALILPVIGGVMIGTPLGIKLHHRFEERTLSWLFFLLAVVIAVRNIIVIVG